MQEQRCSEQPNLTLSHMWCGRDHFSNIPPGAQHQRPAGLLCLWHAAHEWNPSPFHQTVMHLLAAQLTYAMLMWLACYSQLSFNTAEYMRTLCSS